MEQKILATPPVNADTLKKFFLSSLTEVIDHQPLAQMKLEMYQGAQKISQLLTKNQLLIEGDFFQILFAEAALLTSFKLEARLAEHLSAPIKQLGLNHFQHDFKKEVGQATSTI